MPHGWYPIDFDGRALAVNGSSRALTCLTSFAADLTRYPTRCASHGGEMPSSHSVPTPSCAGLKAPFATADVRDVERRYCQVESITFSRDMHAVSTNAVTSGDRDRLTGHCHGHEDCGITSHFQSEGRMRYQDQVAPCLHVRSSRVTPCVAFSRLKSRKSHACHAARIIPPP